MKNIKKILPAIALAGAIGLVSAGSASAYNYSQRVGYQSGTYDSAQDPSNVKICYEVSNIITPFSTTYTIPMSVDSSSSINMNNVSGDNYTADSATRGHFTIAFNEDGSQGTVEKCASLNFANALNPAAAFDTHTVTMGTVTSSNPDAPVDNTAGKQITFGYQLSVDQTGAPTTGSGNIYQAEYWTKSKPSYASAITRVDTYIQVSKTVKGNGAIPRPTNNQGADGFIFKARVVKASGIPDTNYAIYAGDTLITSCEFASSMSDTAHDCEFRLNHGEVAYIGCDSANCSDGGSLPLNATQYSITETETHGHTPYVDDTAGSTTGTKTLNSMAPSHAFRNEKTNTIAGRFFNIIPFIILAILATVGVVTLRKANKKNEA